MANFTTNEKGKDLKKHIVIFSHGHGVKKDDRGMLSDIAEKIPEVYSMLFDYYDVDEENKTIHTKAFSSQVESLSKKIKEARALDKEAVIDIICHSQGSIAASMISDYSDIRKIILTAPVFSLEIERTLDRYKGRADFKFNPDGVTKLPPLDGYVRYSPALYWKERATIVDVPSLYNKLAEKVELIVITAKQDELLSPPDLSKFNEKIKFLEADGDHNFNNEHRAPLVKILRELILS